MMKEANSNTPDFRALKRGTHDEFPVLVTGNMRHGRNKNDILEGCHYYGPAMSFDDNYIMQRNKNVKSVHNIPEPFVFTFEKGEIQTSHGLFRDQDQKHIEGDVYGVPLRKLTQLDRIEGNGDMIERQQRWVTFMSPIQKEKSIRAWVYVVDLKQYLDAFSGSNNLEICRSYGCNNPRDEEFVDVYYHSY
jgi:hypothetical protein